MCKEIIYREAFSITKKFHFTSTMYLSYCDSPVWCVCFNFPDTWAGKMVECKVSVVQAWRSDFRSQALNPGMEPGEKV